VSHYIKNGCKSNFTRKQYIFPKTKRIVYVLGYENLALNYLLKYKEKILNKYIEENEISVYNIPNFKYFDDDNKEHMYYPDIFIKETNLIIEVKSDYTFNKEPRINYIKFKTVSKNGYNLKLMIFNDRKKLVDIHYYFTSGEIYSLKFDKNIEFDKPVEISKSKIDILEF
jgi:hypothetical protein